MNLFSLEIAGAQTLWANGVTSTASALRQIGVAIVPGRNDDHVDAEDH
jgi:hypothetical protein